MVKSSAKANEAYDSHCHDNIKYNVGEKVAMRRALTLQGSQLNYRTDLEGHWLLRRQCPGTCTKK